MPSDHETSREQRVEALAWIRADLRKLYEMGSAQRQNLSDLTRRLDQNAREIADLLEGNGLRDLLAEAKADAWDEGWEACANYVQDAPDNDQKWWDLWHANPYRETTKEDADE